MNYLSKRNVIDDILMEYKEYLIEKRYTYN